MLKYKTCLILTKDKKKILPFYKYNLGIGFIPADIKFTYRNKEYNTIYIMNYIVKNIKKYDLNFKIEHWYNLESGDFNKNNFIKLHTSFHVL
jgi:hypothetical protein